MGHLGFSNASNDVRSESPLESAVVHSLGLEV